MDMLTVVKRNPFVLPMAVAAALAIVFVSEGSYWQSVETLDDLGGMAVARTSIQRLERSLVDAETGQRSYLITNREEHLLPYRKAVQNIGESFAFLDRRYAREPHPAALLRELRSVSDAMLSELAVPLRLHDEGKREAPGELMLRGIGTQSMEPIRTLCAELLEYEAQKVLKGRKDIYQTLMLSRVGVALLSAVILLALVMYLRKSVALLQQQRVQQEAVQAERDRLEVEVRQRTVQLTELAQHLQTAREDERQRLARDLHDELGALLTSAKLDAARIKSRLGSTAPEALQRLADLVAKLDSGISLGRSIIEDLRPSTLGHLGLVPTLEILVREFADRSGLEVEVALKPVRLSPAAELVVYRVVQEAITNLTKYARARKVHVGMAAQNGQVQVSVRDDGAGFDTRQKPRTAYGLLGMRFRVEAAGGRLAVVSAPGQGTLVQMTLPEAPPAAA